MPWTTTTKDLLRQLFVVATERLEAAQEAAVAGQSAGATDENAVDAMHELQKAAQAVAQLADAMTVILARGIDGHPGHPKE